MKRARPFGLALAVLLVGYLVAWPVSIEPLAWAPSEPTAALPPATPLAGLEWLARGKVDGPEAIAVGPDGRVYTATRDGRVVRLSPDGLDVETVAHTQGIPYGLAFDGAGRLFVCDARAGLLSIDRGRVEVLSASHEGRPYTFLDDLDVGPDGTVFFTDASGRFGPGHYAEDIFEHARTGRLLAYEPLTRTTKVLAQGLQFANGVAVAKDGSFVAVNETGEYRVRRYWLSGPKQGQLDTLVDGLPGFPDNVTYSRSRGLFWVAFFAPRAKAVDALAALPRLREVVWRLPKALQPAPRRHALILGVDEAGVIRHRLEDAAPDAFAPVTSVREHQGYLYLGSLHREAVGRIRAPP